MTDLLLKERIADMTFWVKYINKAWKEVKMFLEIIARICPNVDDTICL